MIDCLIKWLQLAPAFDHSPALNRPCLRAWTQLTYFLSFPTSSVFPLPFAMSRIFISPSVQNAKESVNNFRVTLVLACVNEKRGKRRRTAWVFFVSSSYRNRRSRCAVYSFLFCERDPNSPLILFGRKFNWAQICLSKRLVCMHVLINERGGGGNELETANL